VHSPIDFFAAPGSARPGLWRLGVGLVLVIVGWLVWTVIVMAAVAAVNLGRGMPVVQALEAMTALFQGKTPQSVVLQLLTFIGIWPAMWLTLRLLHRQRFGTIFSPEGRLRWADFARGLGLAAGFWAITMVIGVALVGVPERTALPLSTWLPALAPLAVAVFFQASGEELIFRGYILQQLASRWRSPLIWAALPAFLFGLAHYSSGAPLGIGWHYVAVTLLFGLAASALVWRTGSLAAAMGLHTGMNLFSLSGVGLKGVVEGTQLFLYDGSAKLLFMVDGIATLTILLFVLSPMSPFRARAFA